MIGSRHAASAHEEPGSLAAPRLAPLIGLAVLAAGALRKATVPEFVANRELPQEGILPVGDAGAPDADSFKGWLDRRTTLETLLQLNVSPAQQLQASLFILAPLLSAVINRARSEARLSVEGRGPLRFRSAPR